VLHGCREKETNVFESRVGAKGGTVVTRVLRECYTGSVRGQGGALSL
jgi:hypothetical protein